MFKRIIKYFCHRVYTIGKHEEQRIQNEKRKNFLNDNATIDETAWIADSCDIENGRDKNQIIVGSESRLMGSLCVFPYGGKIEIGKNCFVGPDTRIWSGENIKIGDNVLISHHVNITDFSHEAGAEDRSNGFKDFSKNGHSKDKGKIPTRQICIENDVAIYAGAHIIMGVKIGQGSIISAGSVVISDVPPYSQVMGNPARTVWKTKS
jgi:acetyltransferase-like isoleucine patch superfamily enzyme